MTNDEGITNDQSPRTRIVVARSVIGHWDLVIP
jgi:hypothetical protein